MTRPFIAAALAAALCASPALAGGCKSVRAPADIDAVTRHFYAASISTQIASASCAVSSSSSNAQ